MITVFIAGVKEVVMKTISWVLLISMIHFIGCSSTKTYWIHHERSDYDRLNWKFKGKEGKMVLKNGDVIIQEDINIGLDSTSWIEMRDSLYFGAPGRSPIIKGTIATSEIEKFTFMNHSNGNSAGFGYGFLTGAVIGTVFFVNLIEEEKPIEEGYEAVAILYGIVVIAGFGLFGGILGLPIGYAIGGRMNIFSLRCQLIQLLIVVKGRNNLVYI
jgi:hypothetical protein